MLAFLAGKMFDIYQTYAIAYYSASVLLVLAAVMVFFLRPPHHVAETAATEPQDQMDTKESQVNS